jgi:hypothetical protein
MMKVVTYCLCLRNSDIVFDQDKQNSFQEELDNLVGYAKSALTIIQTPLNKFTRHSIKIWALGKTEEENHKIIVDISRFLDDQNILYEKETDYLLWNEENIKIEIPVT